MDNFEFENKKKKKLKKGPLCLLLCILCLVIGSFGGYFIHDWFLTPSVSANQTIFDVVTNIIENDFLDTTESDVSLEERMLTGMITAIGDPHSAYLTTQEAQDLGTTINGAFEGIGITFSAVDAGALVLDVYQGTPAQNAGIQAGDILTHIQGTSIAGYTSDKIKSIVQGESGSEVTIQLLRNGKSMEVTATRGSVDISVAYEIREEDNQKVGYLRITTFGENIATLVESALKDMQSQNVETLVIDLRGNGGGYLDAAQSLLDLFIPEGETMFRVQPYQEDEVLYKATNHQKYQFENGFILVDGDSASASEVITAALKEVCDYQIVGTTTYGKGTVQTQAVISNNAVLKYTYAKWLTPQGNWVHGVGIEPDYEVTRLTLDDFHIASVEESYAYDQVDSHIAYMQEMLEELGYAVDRTDGYFSSQTKTALMAFEKDYGLTVDGIYEQNDATILLNVLAYHIYQEVEDTQYQKILELIQ